MTGGTERVPYQPAGLTPESPNNPGFIWYDKLSTIFAGQRALMDRYFNLEDKTCSFPVDTDEEGELDFVKVQARLHEMFGFTVRELSEAMQELRWKPWKQRWAHTDREKFVEEMADALHFFVEMCITAGINADGLFDAYFRAWEKNRGRQENGYADPTEA